MAVMVAATAAVFTAAVAARLTTTAALLATAGLLFTATAALLAATGLLLTTAVILLTTAGLLLASAAALASATATARAIAATMVVTEGLGLTFHGNDHGSHGGQTKRQSNDISHHKSSKQKQKIERSNLMSEMRDRRTKAKPSS